MEERQIIKFLDRTLDNMTTITVSVAISQAPGNSDRWWLNTDWLIISVEKKRVFANKRCVAGNVRKQSIFRKVNMILADDY